MSMNTLNEIKAEIERESERRAELWHVLSTGHDAGVAAEIKELEERIQRLWDEERAVRAHLRFGDRDEIIKRARHEERLARAA
jgi:LytS/YehU family sensor histidine kinase